MADDELVAQHAEAPEIHLYRRMGGLTGDAKKWMLQFQTILNLVQIRWKVAKQGWQTWDFGDMNIEIHVQLF